MEVDSIDAGFNYYPHPNRLTPSSQALPSSALNYLAKRVDPLPSFLIKSPNNQLDTPHHFNNPLYAPLLQLLIPHSETLWTPTSSPTSLTGHHHYPSQISPSSKLYHSQMNPTPTQGSGTTSSERPPHNDATPQFSNTDEPPQLLTKPTDAKPHLPTLVGSTLPLTIYQSAVSKSELLQSPMNPHSLWPQPSSCSSISPNRNCHHSSSNNPPFNLSNDTIKPVSTQLSQLH